MNKIPSFTIDHERLLRGIYVSRKDQVGGETVTTFDIRMKEPNREPVLHNGAIHTPEALPTILTCLINDGYTVLPVSQLILPPPYTIDHTGRQFPAEESS